MGREERERKFRLADTGAAGAIDPGIETKIMPLGAWILGKMHPQRKTQSGLVLPESQELVRLRLEVLRLGPDVKADIRVGDRVVLNPMIEPVRVGRWHGYDTSDGSELFLYAEGQIPAVIRGDDPVAPIES